MTVSPTANRTASDDPQPSTQRWSASICGWVMIAISSPTCPAGKYSGMTDCSLDICIAEPAGQASNRGTDHVQQWHVVARMTVSASVASAAGVSWHPRCRRLARWTARSQAPCRPSIGETMLPLAKRSDGMCVCVWLGVCGGEGEGVTGSYRVGPAPL